MKLKFGFRDPSSAEIFRADHTRREPYPYQVHIRIISSWNAAGLSQAALAERMNVDRADIGSFELGQKNPTILTLWHTAKAVKIEIRSSFEEILPGLNGTLFWSRLGGP